MQGAGPAADVCFKRPVHAADTAPCERLRHVDFKFDGPLTVSYEVPLNTI
jgi:hypothetical protein